MSHLISLLGATLGALALLVAPPAQADPLTSQELNAYLSTGKYDAGIKDFDRRHKADPSNPATAYALGALEFFGALANLQEDLRRYQFGAEIAKNAALLRPFTGDLTTSPHPNPETASYEKIRLMLTGFADGMERASRALSTVGETPVKLVVRVDRIAFDTNLDGTIDEAERLPTLLNAFDNQLKSNNIDLSEGLEIAFDNADAKWLESRAHTIMAFPNFFLAFDFETTFETTFQMFFGNEATEFGRALLAMVGSDQEIQDLRAEIDAIAARKNEAMTPEQTRLLREKTRERDRIRFDGTLSPEEKTAMTLAIDEEITPLQAADRDRRALEAEESILKMRLSALDPANPATPSAPLIGNGLDALNLFHSINWKVVDRERLLRTRDNILTAARLGQEVWELAQQETDNDREWLPNLNQQSAVGHLTVTADFVEVWQTSLRGRIALMEGTALSPHIRFPGGINLKRFFEEVEHFDLIAFAVGPGALSFVEKGEVLNTIPSVTFNRRRTGQPDSETLLYALWFI
ncbi:MAG: hypothetical protein AAGE61_04835 [Pseudomonadota bacterium]